MMIGRVLVLVQFQPTLPVRGATPGLVGIGQLELISTHAPRAGSDVSISPIVTSSLNFNPRSPCGERRRPDGWSPSGYNFNPRSPCGERPEAKCCPLL